ncbi:MAG: glutathione S-transferase family protein [Halioglobus sp.]
MSNVQLVIGNRNYSSWSLRAWLCLRKSGVAFEEIVLPLDCSEFDERIGEYSPTRRVPVMWDDDQCIWDSLAICEYANDNFAQGRLWPDDSYSRGWGRAMTAEMHGGFPDLRNKLPMNCRARNRYVAMDDALQSDINRIFSLWGDSLISHSDDGPWLLGQFSIADAMYAPVAMRFRTYGISLPQDISSYCEYVWNDSDVVDWCEKADEETWIVEADEAGVDRDNG